MNQHIANTNWLPYIIILIMGFMLYTIWDTNQELKAENKQQETDLSTAYATMGIIQSYNEDRFRELEKVKTRKWKEGKHEAKF